MHPAAAVQDRQRRIFEVLTFWRQSQVGILKVRLPSSVGAQSTGCLVAPKQSLLCNRFDDKLSSVWFKCQQGNGCSAAVLYVRAHVWDKGRPFHTPSLCLLTHFCYRLCLRKEKQVNYPVHTVWETILGSCRHSIPKNWFSNWQASRTKEDRNPWHNVSTPPPWCFYFSFMCTVE